MQEQCARRISTLGLLTRRPPIRSKRQVIGLNEGELISMIALLIFAGHETTSNLIGNGL